MSWRAGRGRRQWVSMGPAGWLLIGPYLLTIWLMWWMVAGTVLLCVWLSRVAVMAARGGVRFARQRQAERAAAAAPLPSLSERMRYSDRR